jgi:hypothetical protein
MNNVVVRALNSDEARLLTAARLVAVEHAPYLAHALFTTHPIAAEGLGTFAVDPVWRLYLDPAVLAAWGPWLSGGVLVHEIGHLVRAHAERADALGADIDHDCWDFRQTPRLTMTCSRPASTFRTEWSHPSVSDWRAAASKRCITPHSSNDRPGKRG